MQSKDDYQWALSISQDRFSMWSFQLVVIGCLFGDVKSIECFPYRITFVYFHSIALTYMDRWRERSHAAHQASLGLCAVHLSNEILYLQVNYIRKRWTYFSMHTSRNRTILQKSV